MPATYGSQSQVTGAALAISIFSSVDHNFLDVEYPERLWKKVMGSQVNGSVNAGAQNHVRMVKDYQAAAAFQGNTPGSNIPRVGLSIGAITSPLAVSAIGADITNEDARQYKFGQLGTLPQDLQAAMVEGCQNLIESTFFFGDASVGFIAWLSYTGITVITVPSTGTGSSPLWTAKTPYQIWYDINTALAYMYISTNTLFVPDTIYLPPAQFLLLQQPYVIGGVAVATSILKYVLENNVANALGKTLKIEPIRYLAGAGTSATDRAVVMCHDKKYQEIAMPLPYTLQAPVPYGLGSSLFAEQKHGTYACYQPGTMLYMDGL
jgi:hypothetical protein